MSGVESIAINGGRIEALTLEGGPATPLVVLGGVETGLRPLAGTEQLLERRWERRRAGRTVTIVGRPLPDDPADADRIMHPRVMADAVAVALDALGIGSAAFEAESGAGGSACG